MVGAAMSAEQSRGSEPYKVVEIRCLHANCWGAKCKCGTWLTKHDWDADEARRNAEDAIMRTDRWGHSCKHTEARQMSLSSASRSSAKDSVGDGADLLRVGRDAESSEVR